MENRISGWRRLSGDAITLAFAALWAGRGSLAAGWPMRPALIVLAAISLVLFAGLVRRDIVLKRSQTLHDPRLWRRMRIARIVLLALIGNLTHAWHRPGLLLPLTGLVIGASYLLQARALREPVHVPVGVLIIAVTLGSLAFAPPLSFEIAGFGTALAVWSGCALRLWREKTVLAPVAATP